VTWVKPQGTNRYRDADQRRRRRRHTRLARLARISEDCWCRWLSGDGFEVWKPASSLVLEDSVGPRQVSTAFEQRYRHKDHHEGRAWDPGLSATLAIALSGNEV